MRLGLVQVLSMTTQRALFACDHCFHPFRGPLLMVVQDGHVVVKCCKCPETKTEHADHLHNRARRSGR